MARYSAGVKTSAGSTTLPLASLYAAAGSGGRLREVGITNTTSTALDVKLVRMSDTGTRGAGLTEAKHNPDSPAAACTAATTHSIAPTITDDLGYRASIGAAIGAGVIWTFGDTGIGLATGAGNGIGIVIENGTGQACQVDFVWDE